MATFQNAFARLHDFSPAARVQPVRIMASVSRRLYPGQNHQPAPKTITFFALSREPEDARITGGTRSLDRRLLALNLSGTLSEIRSRSKLLEDYPT